MKYRRYLPCPHGRPASIAGFTLMELLVALAIFAIMSMMAYGGLSSMLNAREQTGEAADRLTQLQKGFMRLQQDIEQIVARGVRDKFGDSLPVLTGGQLPLLELTRGGRSNPAGLSRSALQRVSYRLEDGRLLRISWPVLDRVQETSPYESLLMEGITDMELRFLDEEWVGSWPPPGEAGKVPLLPRAVEVRLVLNDWGEINRLFRVAR